MCHRGVQLIVAIVSTLHCYYLAAFVYANQNWCQGWPFIFYLLIILCWLCRSVVHNFCSFTLHFWPFFYWFRALCLVLLASMKLYVAFFFYDSVFFSDTSSSWHFLNSNIHLGRILISKSIRITLLKWNLVKLVVFGKLNDRFKRIYKKEVKGESRGSILENPNKWTIFMKFLIMRWFFLHVM